jgi:hypothetical protein
MKRRRRRVLEMTMSRGRYPAATFIKEIIKKTSLVSR